MLQHITINNKSKHETEFWRKIDCFSDNFGDLKDVFVLL